MSNNVELNSELIGSNIRKIRELQRKHKKKLQRR